MIRSAKKETSTKTLATRLQTNQVGYWVKTQKGPEEVFKLYKLNNAGRHILGKSQFSDWVNYVDDLNAKNEGTVASIIPTLRKYFRNEDLFHC
ncbi:hypothetical protein P3T76_010373 [Phytophthora citrophthora]|uniref:RxLR effector PexRD54 WY domain-containing protein n=1 Tax=Phytophthora citrophthora TaxID=4793 RepID=A0AAD9LG95_9STRA|nr:hypothetical protein P3T76_010373 [Phytophthora citrophthora]